MATMRFVYTQLAFVWLELAFLQSDERLSVVCAVTCVVCFIQAALAPASRSV